MLAQNKPTQREQIHEELPKLGPEGAAGEKGPELRVEKRESLTRVQWRAAGSQFGLRNREAKRRERIEGT